MAKWLDVIMSIAHISGSTLNAKKLKAFPKSKTWYCPECQKRRRGKSIRVQRTD